MLTDGNISLPRSGMSFTTVVVTVIIVIATVLVLKYVPLKPDTSSFAYSIILEPQSSDIKFFNAPKDYSVSGTFSANSSDPVEFILFYGPSIFADPDKIIVFQRAESGNFNFKAIGYADNNEFYIELKNPENLVFLAYPGRRDQP